MTTEIALFRPLQMGQREVVAKRPWKLASYEVAGGTIKKNLRPGGTPDFRRPVRTAETRCENASHHNPRGILSLNLDG
jgi:hypothetical protein